MVNEIEFNIDKQELEQYESVLELIQSDYKYREGINGLGIGLNDDDELCFVFILTGDVAIPSILYGKYRTHIMNLT